MTRWIVQYIYSVFHVNTISSRLQKEILLTCFRRTYALMNERHNARPGSSLDNFCTSTSADVVHWHEDDGEVICCTSIQLFEFGSHTTTVYDDCYNTYGIGNWICSLSLAMRHTKDYSILLLHISEIWRASATWWHSNSFRKENGENLEKDLKLEGEEGSGKINKGIWWYTNRGSISHGRIRAKPRTDWRANGEFCEIY